MLNYQHHKVDLSNCDNEPIHHIGRIQSHGFLLIINPESFEIEQSSANVGEFVTLPAQSTEALSWQDFKDEKVLEQLRPYLAKELKEPDVFLLEMQQRKFLSFLHRADGKLVLNVSLMWL